MRCNKNCQLSSLYRQKVSLSVLELLQLQELLSPTSLELFDKMSTERWLDFLSLYAYRLAKARKPRFTSYKLICLCANRSLELTFRFGELKVLT
jgi:hypothetical protein